MLVSFRAVVVVVNNISIILNTNNVICLLIRNKLLAVWITLLWQYFYMADALRSPTNSVTALEDGWGQHAATTSQEHCNSCIGCLALQFPEASLL